MFNQKTASKKAALKFKVNVRVVFPQKNKYPIDLWLVFILLYTVF